MAARRKKAKKAAPKKAVPQIVVASRAKEFVKSKKMMTASETVDAINAKVCDMLKSAITRAQANKRKILRPQDL